MKRFLPPEPLFLFPRSIHYQVPYRCFQRFYFYKDSYNVFCFATYVNINIYWPCSISQKIHLLSLILMVFHCMPVTINLLNQSSIDRHYFLLDFFLMITSTIMLWWKSFYVYAGRLCLHLYRINSLQKESMNF